jgi:hypothetical protein
MLGAITGRPVEQRLSASVAAALLAAQRNARILRVHDVAETRDALAVWQAVEAIDGRPYFAKHSIDDGKQEEIAAIDPDSEWGVAPVPDGMS